MGDFRRRAAHGRACRVLAFLAITGIAVAGCAGASSRSSSGATPGGGGHPAGAPAGLVGHAGRWLTDSSGRVLLLRGVNVVAKDPPYYPAAFGFSDADAAWLAANGMEAVRLGVLPSGEMPTEGKIDTSYVDKIVANVELLGAHGIYSLLDWHQDDYGTYFQGDGMPDWMTVTGGKPDNQVAFPLDYTSNPALQQAFQSFWDDAPVPGGTGLQEYYVQMLTAIAQRVAHNPWVLGYEIMNEPWPGNSWAGCLTGSGCSDLENAELAPFYAKASRAIRAIDTVHLIFVEPFSLFNFGLAPTHLTLPAGITGLGLSFHQYALNAQGQRQVFAFAQEWSAATGGALLNTEWSTANSDLSTLTTQADEEDAALMPWTYWVFANCDIACSPAAVANFLLDSHQPPVGANVNTPLVSKVFRPYPVAVSGTPTAVSLGADGVAHITWDTKRASGSGSFTTGAVSAIAAPSVAFPGGYSVSAIGARVVSAPCSPLLLVSQDAPVTQVSVTLTPATACR